MKGRIFVAIVLLSTVVFTALKLTHLIAWSWWWIISPTWIGGVLVGLLMSFHVWLMMEAEKNVERRPGSEFKKHLDKSKRIVRKEWDMKIKQK